MSFRWYHFGPTNWRDAFWQSCVLSATDPPRMKRKGIMSLAETAECAVFAAIRKGGFPADLHQDSGQWPRKGRRVGGKA